MTNPFKALISKIVAGSKFLGEHVWAALKAAFGTNTKEITLAALQSAKELLKTELGEYIHQVVAGLENSTLSGPDRLKTATTSIKDFLNTQGKSMSTDWIQWAIHTILIFIRGVAPAAASDPVPPQPVPEEPPAAA
jgi:hypothetical protein